MRYVLGLVLLCVATAAESTLRINEFVARPAGGEGEWVELVNAGTAPVSLDGWWIADATGRQRLFPSGLTLDPGHYLVAAARPDSLRVGLALPDSIRVVRPDGWPILNDNDGSGGAPADILRIGFGEGAASDSVAYFAAWLPPEAGQSLERVDTGLPGSEAGAWGWCADARGHTAGERNSLAGGDSGGGPPALWDGPRIVDPAAETAVFTYRLPGPGVMAVWLLEPGGREVAVLREAAPAPAVGRWAWGPDTPAPPGSGHYLLCLRWQAEAASRRSCRSVWVRR